MADHGSHLPFAPWPPQFSDSLVDAARALLDDRPVLVIVGPSSVSRNQLASRIARLPEGPAWCRHVARHGELDTPWFGLRQIFPTLHPAPGDDAASVGAAAAAHLRETDATPTTLMLGDAQLCDPETVDVLVALAESGVVRLVATLPLSPATPQRRLLATAEVLDLPPLGAPVVSGLLEARFGARPDAALVDLVVERSDGAYARVCEIADSAVASGLFVIVDGALVLDASREPHATPLLTSPLVTDPADLAPGALDVVHLISLLGGVDVDDAHRCLSTSAIDDLVTRGTLHDRDGLLTFGSAVESSLSRRTVSQARQTELFEQLGASLPRTLARPGIGVRAADWFRASGQLLPVDLALRAAREANLSGRHRRAVVYTDPRTIEGGRTVALIERIYALVEIGDYVTLRAVYASLDPRDLTEEELLPYFRWLGRLKDGTDRSALADQAIASPTPGVARRRAAVRTLSELVERAFLEAGEGLSSQLRALAFTDLLSPSNRAMAFTTLAAVLRNSGRPAQAVEAADFALTLLDAQGHEVSAFHLVTAREYQVFVLLSAVELDRAERAIRAYSEGPFGREGSGRLTTAAQAVLDIYRGDAPSALANLQMCLAGLHQHDPRNIRGWLLGVMALVLVQCERPDEAIAALESSRRHRTRRAQWDLETRIAHASVLDALADPEEALEVLDEVYAEAGRRDMLLVQIDAAVLSVTIGGPPHVAALLAIVDDIVDPSGTTAVWQTFAHAARDYDIAALVALAEQLNDRRAVLLTAAVAQYVLDVARRADDLDAATRLRMQQLSDPRTVRRAG